MSSVGFYYVMVLRHDTKTGGRVGAHHIILDRACDGLGFSNSPLTGISEVIHSFFNDGSSSHTLFRNLSYAEKANNQLIYHNALLDIEQILDSRMEKSE